VGKSIFLRNFVVVDVDDFVASSAKKYMHSGSEKTQTRLCKLTV